MCVRVSAGKLDSLEKRNRNSEVAVRVTSAMSKDFHGWNACFKGTMPQEKTGEQRGLQSCIQSGLTRQYTRCSLMTGVYPQYHTEENGSSTAKVPGVSRQRAFRPTFKYKHNVHRNKGRSGGRNCLPPTTAKCGVAFVASRQLGTWRLAHHLRETDRRRLERWPLHSIPITQKP